MKMIIYSNGMYDSNSYILIGENKKAVLIDAGAPREFYLNEAKNKGFTIEYLLLTHGHFDHTVGALGLQKTGVKVYASEKDLDFFTNKSPLARALGVKTEGFTPDSFVTDNQVLSLCGLNIKVIETPGHSRGCVCYHIGEKLFCGDTLFLGNIGRTDLPGGDYKQLIGSIKNKIFILNNDTVIYSGHGENTSVRQEKRLNPYVREK